ncbi:MAG: Gfo/Idh/MocA family oxidoreductase [Bacteroidota bacterium]
MKIKLACIGAGYFARFHIEAWKRLAEIELVAICDKDEAKASILAQEFQITKVYTNVDELMKKETFEIIDIITPPETHLALCQKFAQAGKHIICQKPLAPTLSEAQKLAAIIKNAGIRFMVHENFRFQPWYRKIKELLLVNAIGDKIHDIHLKMRMGDGWGENAYANRQPYFRQMPRLFIYETGIHYIDVFRYLIGEVDAVYARLRTLNSVIAGEDSALVFFEFKNGTHGILDGNRYNESNCEDARYTFGETTIEGSKGTIRLYNNGKITIQLLGKQEEEIIYQHENKNFAGDCVYFTQQHFIEAFSNNLPFETNIQDYLKNISVQEAIYESSKIEDRILVPN